MEYGQELWKLIYEHLAEEISETALRVWFSGVEDACLQGQTLLLCCPDQCKRDAIASYYSDSLRAVLGRLFSVEMDVRLLSREEYRPVEPRTGEGSGGLRESGEFTFDRFVVGPSNKLACAAARAAAEGQSRYHNPLVIYGPSGMGKTHLLNAVAAEVERQSPQASVVYVKGDEFTNDLILALQEGSNAQFREKYRTVDYFLMDDVQFIAGKKQTQEEFFHTFDKLYESGCQMVVTMDRPPRDLDLLEGRICSRFEGGLIVELGEPDYETRLAILKSKAEQRQLVLSAEDADYVARCVTGSVRRLEGLLNRLRADVSLRGERMDSALIRRAADSMQILRNDRPTPEEILRSVAQHYQVDSASLRGKSRSRQVVRARQAAMYLIRRESDLTTTGIGALFGRDHTTVMYALNEMEKKLAADKAFGEELKNIL